MSDEFMGSSYECQMNFWDYPWILFFVHTSKYSWTKAFAYLSRNLCRGEESRVFTSCSCFRGFCWY